MKKLFILDLAPVIIIDFIILALVFFDRELFFVKNVVYIFLGIQNLILPFFYAGVYGVLHFEHGLGCVKGALATILAGILSGTIFLVLAYLLEIIMRGEYVRADGFFEFSDIAFFILPQIIIIPGVIVVLITDVVKKIREKSHQGNKKIF